jgi:hypothetical protein
VWRAVSTGELWPRPLRSRSWTRPIHREPPLDPLYEAIGRAVITLAGVEVYVFTLASQLSGRNYERVEKSNLTAALEVQRPPRPRKGEQPVMTVNPLGGLRPKWKRQTFSREGLLRLRHDGRWVWGQIQSNSMRWCELLGCGRRRL